MRFFLRIESEPGALARVLQPFAVAGQAPRALFLRSRERGVAFVVAEFDSPDRVRALLFKKKLEQMPCVIGARLGSWE